MYILLVLCLPIHPPGLDLEDSILAGEDLLGGAESLLAILTKDLKGEGKKGCSGGLTHNWACDMGGKRSLGELRERSSLFQ